VPIYEYACRKCNHTLDALQKMSDDPLVDCPACGEPALRKLLSAPRFRLKGKGWYETDFKGDNQRNLQSSDSEPATSSKSDSKSDGKSDSKSGSKPGKEAAGKTSASTTSKSAAKAEKS
jgi:putative FmdB family regulatory protein